jgi:hypothetical protein
MASLADVRTVRVRVSEVAGSLLVVEVEGVKWVPDGGWVAFDCVILMTLDYVG